MEDQGHPDHKVIGVPLGEPVWADIQALDDVPPHMLKEIEHFFTVYKDLEEKKTAALGWHNLDETLEIIAKSRAAYRG
jgi:inorganic pyrophosphatase